MQKKILSAAVAAALVAPAAVWAQSTTVLYGLVDVGYQNVSKYGPGATNKSAFGNSGARSSRLGVRANEDLGGGLSARAVIEFDISGDSGAEGANQMTGRQTFVSLDSKSWGELSLGRQLTHSFGNVAIAEGIAGANSFQSFYTMEDQITRSSNYLKYSSPKIGGGFTFGAGWAPGEDATLSTATGSNKNNRNYFDWHVRWEQGPFGIGLAQARFTSNTLGAAVAGQGVVGATGTLVLGTNNFAAQAIGTDFKEKDTSLAAYYKFSMARIYGVHSRSRQSGATAAENLRLNGARVEFDIGKGTIAISAAKRKNKLTAASDSSFFGLGYYYAWTPRTQMYATYGRMKNDPLATLNLNGAWTGTATAGFDPRGLQVGMGHSF